MEEKIQELKLKEKIYSNLKKVPYGKVITYKNLADSVNSDAFRFVGLCMKQNKNTDKIPCFRVVKSSGNIGEYSRGKEKKIKLLEKEGIEVIDGKVDLIRFGFKF